MPRERLRRRGAPGAARRGRAPGAGAPRRAHRAMVATSCNGFCAAARRPRRLAIVARVRGAVAASWPALRVFLWSRLALWALAAGTVLVFEDELNPARGRWDSARLHELGAAVDVWARWDSDWYLRIAESGYDWPSSTPAFFPLYPLLVGGLGRLLDDHFLLAGLVISLVACAVAFVLLYRLVRSAAPARRRAAVRPLPRALPDVAVPRRGVRRVAVPRARARDLRPRREAAHGVGGGRRRAGASHAAAGRRPPAGARGLRVALGPAAARSRCCSPSPSRSSSHSRSRSSSPSGTASRSSTRNASGSAPWRRSARSAGSSRRSARETCSGRSSRSRCSPSRCSPGDGSERRTVSMRSVRSRCRWRCPPSGSAASTRSHGSRSPRSPVWWPSRSSDATDGCTWSRSSVLARARGQRGSMGAVVLGRVTVVPRPRLVGWAILVGVLASISYAANFLASTDTSRRGDQHAPVAITTDGEHGFATGDAVTVRDVEGNTGRTASWTGPSAARRPSARRLEGSVIPPATRPRRRALPLVDRGRRARPVRDHPRDRPRAGARPCTRHLGLRAPASWSGAAGWLVAAIVAIWVIGAILNIFLEAGEEQGLVPDDWDPDRAAAFAANFVVVALVAPVVEELTYRGLGFAAVRSSSEEAPPSSSRPSRSGSRTGSSSRSRS